MLARVIETIYWMARYLERAENIARLINVNSHLLLDLPKGISPGWEPLIDITGTRAQYLDLYNNFSESNVVAYLVTDIKSPASLRFALNAARENARTTRDVIPQEAWEQLNTLHFYASEYINYAQRKTKRFDYFNSIITYCQTINGLLADTMNRDAGYLFLQIGRYIERADMSSRIIDVRTTNLLNQNNHLEFHPFANIQWMSVLKSMTAYQMYRREVQVNISQEQVLTFLLKSKVFPRSIYFCIAEVARNTNPLPKSEAVLSLINQTLTSLLSKQASDLTQQSLHMYLDKIQVFLTQIGDKLDNTYFLSDRVQKTTAHQTASNINDAVSIT
ncbi:alpha-E domain-containing protein [Zooshikella ganghwensis]|uniref:Alpha-E domain-containing protein n=1 Tax=Zooshikella ganghwensis TaxID=202772 RepID=A0A4P9VNJ1_9GAMM|nr:alpha-E domain-containing protein [Zooshikella ganghwensis]